VAGRPLAAECLVPFVREPSVVHQVKILVPGNHLMVGLLGQRDELLRTVEEAFGGTQIHVRGNEITSTARSRARGPLVRRARFVVGTRPLA